MSRLLCAVLFAIPAASLLAAEDDPKKVAESLQGEWKIVSFNKGGEEVPKDELAGAKIVVAGEKMTISFNKKDEAATFKINAKANPPAIDIIPSNDAKNTVVKGIYKLEKDKLTICFGPDGSQRPGEFKAGKTASVFVLEKAKK